MSGYEVIKGKNKYDHYEINIPTEEVGIVYGSYEVWDRDSGGVMFYEEGQLIFEDGELIDYDGYGTMAELPESIINEVAKIRKVSL